MSTQVPHPRVPITDSSGLLSPQWYRFFTAFHRDTSALETTAGLGLEKSNGAISIPRNAVTNDMLSHETLSTSVICNADPDSGPVQYLQASDDGRVLQRDAGRLVFRIHKAPSFTVATLPAASDVGAGTQVFASDARNAGEAAGAGTGAMVVSDGTNWKIPGVGTPVTA